MENTVAGSLVAAPYASTAIPLFLTSTTGLRYRTLHCLECGAEFIERNNDSLYRLNDESQPAEITLDGSVVVAICGQCRQQYTIQVSLNVVLEEGGVPLYMQPQSVYIISHPLKKLRYLKCMECGKAFQSISDRISQVVDNRVPFEYLDPDKLGVFEILCHRPTCSQVWALMI